MSTRSRAGWGKLSGWRSLARAGVRTSRPATFAPSVLEEARNQYFVDAAPDPFMMQVRPILSEKQPVIPAVTHVDGSGRLQTVSPRSNQRYYDLIRAFARITGVPMLLNTSFNENEPIVLTPEQALDCFLRTSMDVLVIGRHVLERASVPAAAMSGSPAQMEIP